MNTPDRRIEAKRISDENAEIRKRQDSEFMTELTTTLNRGCRENASGTPDFILAIYLQGCLDAFNRAVNAREAWYGRPQDPRFGTPEKGIL